MDNHIRAVEEEIRKVEADIQAATEELARATDKDDKVYWRKEKEQLRKKEEQLRKKEEQLREEKLIALRDGAAPGPGPGILAAEEEVKTITVILEPMLDNTNLVQFDRSIQDQRGLKELLKDVQSVGLLHIGKEVEDGAEEDGAEEDGASLMLSAEKLRRVPTLVTKFEELKDGAIYTVAASSKDVIRKIRQQFVHMLQACEDDLGEAMLSHALKSKPGTECSLRPGLRVLLEPNGRPSMEVDAVVVADDDTAYLASHKLHLAGPKPVEDIVKAVEKVKQRSTDAYYSHTGYAEFGRFKTLVAVLGAEKVETKSEARIRDACKKNGVIFFKRNGRSFSVTSMHSVQRGHFGHARAFGRM